jgi:hypothetical protein
LDPDVTGPQPLYVFDDNFQAYSGADLNLCLKRRRVQPRASLSGCGTDQDQPHKCDQANRPGEPGTLLSSDLFHGHHPVLFVQRTTSGR